MLLLLDYFERLGKDGFGFDQQGLTCLAPFLYYQPLLLIEIFVRVLKFKNEIFKRKVEVFNEIARNSPK
jgi:hypothetical protein